MSDTLKLSNSIWNNGMQVDSDGYAIFYPLGTNKVNIPTDESAWPQGTKLISPFVYDENDNLVGFCDTKSMIVTKPTSITIPYTHIEADFSSIEEEMLIINAPNAVFKDIKWADNNSSILPVGYKRLEYLEGTGTQCIDSLECVYRLSLDFQGTSFDMGDRKVYFGIYDDYNKQTRESTYQLKCSSAADVHGVQVGMIGINSPFTYGVPFRIIIDENGDVYRDGEKIGTVVLSQNNDVNATAMIWAQNTYYGYSRRIEYHVRAQISSVVLSRDGNLLRNFIPALDPTGAPCLFDTVKRESFYNIGTGDFLYPSDSTTFSLRKELPSLGKLSQYGLQRLYHTPSNYNGSIEQYAAENNYKNIIETPKPSEGDWEPSWTESDENIILSWTEIIPTNN